MKIITVTDDQEALLKYLLGNKEIQPISPINQDDNTKYEKARLDLLVSIINTEKRHDFDPYGAVLFMKYGQSSKLYNILKDAFGAGLPKVSSEYEVEDMEVLFKMVGELKSGL